MKKFAAILVETGAVAQIQRYSSTGTENLDGTQQDGLLYKDVTNHEDIGDELAFQRTKYWRNDQWNERPARPSPIHEWRNFEWVEDSTRLWRAIKNQRDALLVRSDWTQIPDAVLPENVTAEMWREYRQELRDLPANQSDVTNYYDIVWPQKPQPLPDDPA